MGHLGIPDWERAGIILEGLEGIRWFGENFQGKKVGRFIGGLGQKKFRRSSQEFFLRNQSFPNWNLLAGEPNLFNLGGTFNQGIFRGEKAKGTQIFFKRWVFEIRAFLNQGRKGGFKTHSFYRKFGGIKLGWPD